DTGEAGEQYGDIRVWSSYVMSPAAMFNPDVMRHNDPDDSTSNGWRDPWSLAAGFRSPSMSQARYPNLKTHMLEHNWLQNPKASCNPSFQPGTYLGNCEPYYFNHSWDSSPATMFYDGHIESVGVRRASRADARVQGQTGGWGLWSRDTPFGEEGYFISEGFDQAETSFHILTTDGILGRDVSADGGPKIVNQNHPSGPHIVRPVFFTRRVRVHDRVRAPVRAPVRVRARARVRDRVRARVRDRARVRVRGRDRAHARVRDRAVLIRRDGPARPPETDRQNWRIGPPTHVDSPLAVSILLSSPVRAHLGACGGRRSAPDRRNNAP
ncbi:MAG: hypothetical protein HKN37_16195, partial [Rhodothermales bacterium]|nr:hypothetical protein [Rhodothermales bacterium]